jgi:deoxycytidine triphosphate deaminase
MILTGSAIAEEVSAGRIVISPFDHARLNPNSYNFTLGGSLKIYVDNVLDTRRENRTATISMTDGSLLLEPRRLYLAHSRERMGSQFYVPTYAARSSIARLGMFINLSASLGDIGFVGQWTIQLFALHPIRVYEGMEIGQMMFWSTQGKIQLYEGKYQNAAGPVASQIFRDKKRVLVSPA